MKLNPKNNTMKPCPFCGRKASMNNAGLYEFWVECNNERCSSTGPVRRTEAGAINAWNHRAGEEKNAERNDGGPAFPRSPHSGEPTDDAMLAEREVSDD